MAGYGGFGAIVKEAKILAENPAAEVACPKCGEPLQSNAAGVKNCPQGHYRANQ